MKEGFFLLITLIILKVGNAQQMYINKTTVIGAKVGCDNIQLQSTSDGGAFWTALTKDSTGTGDYPLCSHRTDSLKMVIGKIDSNGNNEWVKVFCDWNAQASVGCPSLDNGYAIPSFTLDTPDIYLTKLDCQGKVQWQKRWGSSGEDIALKIIQNIDSSYIVLGGTDGNDGDIPFSYQPPNSSFIYSDIVLIKTDKNGNKEWLKIYGSSTSDWSKFIYSIGDYYYLIANTDGYSNDHDFSNTNPYPGNSTCYLMKIDSLGTIVWSRSIGNLGVNDALWDKVDSTFMCVSASRINVPPINKNDGNSNSDYGVVKVNLEGQVVWAKHFGDTAYDDIPTGICKGPGNSYLILGQTMGTSIQPITPIGQADGLIYWVDSTGNEIEHKFYGNVYSQNPEKIVPLNNHQYLVADHAGALTPFTEGNWYFGSGVQYGIAFSVWDIWPTSIPNIPNSVISNLKVYPNPTNESITVILPNNKNTFIIRAYNIEGKMMALFTTSKGNEKFQINTKEWASGNYIISCTGPNKSSINARVIIQH